MISLHQQSAWSIVQKHTYFPQQDLVELNRSLISSVCIIAPGTQKTVHKTVNLSARTQGHLMQAEVTNCTIFLAQS